MTTSFAHRMLLILALFTLVMGCSQPKVAQKGDRVKVQYVGSTMDGEVFDSTTADDPLIFVVGNGEVVPGVDKAVEGMTEGESKTVELETEDAYGQRNEQAVATISRENMPPEIQLEVGKALAFNPPGGQQQLFTVVGFTEDSVTLDGNHPLAGQSIKFDLTLQEIVPAEK